MRYYRITRKEGKYRVQIYKILFCSLFPVFDAYTGNIQEVNAMLNRYRAEHKTDLQTVTSL